MKMVGEECMDMYASLSCAKLQNVIFSYKGMLTEELNGAIISHVESMMVSFEETKRLRKRMLNLLIECIQNIYHHVTPIRNRSNEVEASTIFEIGRTDNGYYLKTGNYMPANEVEGLEKRLTMLEHRTPHELRLLFRHALVNGSRTKKGGGLGLVEIARRSGNNLSHQFIRVNRKTAFFLLKVEINN